MKREACPAARSKSRHAVGSTDITAILARRRVSDHKVRHRESTMIQRARRFLKRLGPGLITGAADDDPSGIATYSQSGAQFGFGMLWSVLFTTPLMVGIQIVSARIGRVTGHGLAANVREHFPRPVLYAGVSLLLLANTLNLAADLSAMGDALVLLAGGKSAIYIVFFALLSLTLQIFIPFR